MQLDKKIRFGLNKVCYTYSSDEYDRSRDRWLTQLSRHEVNAFIDKCYLNGINYEYLKEMDVDDYLVWRQQPYAKRELVFYRTRYIRNRLKEINEMERSSI